VAGKKLAVRDDIVQWVEPANDPTLHQAVTPPAWLTMAHLKYIQQTTHILFNQLLNPSV